MQKIQVQKQLLKNAQREAQVIEVQHQRELLLLAYDERRLNLPRHAGQAPVYPF